MAATRTTASLALAVVGAVVLVLGAFLVYARVTVFDSEEFADRASTSLAAEPVQEALTAPIVNTIVDSGPAELINAQPILEAAVGGMIDSAAFRRAFRDAVRGTHSALFEGTGGGLVLDLADAGVIAIEAVRSISPDVARDIPEDLEPELIEITDHAATLGLADLAHDVRELALVLPALGLVLLAGSVALAPTRRTGLIRVGAAIGIASGAVLAVVLIARSLVIAQFDDELVGDAARAGWDAFLGDALLWFGALGAAAVIVAASAFAGVREVDPGVPLRRLAAIASWRPVRPSIRLLRAIAILAASLLVVVQPQVVLHILVIAAGGWGLFVGVSEVLLVVAPPPDPVTASTRERAAGLLARLRPGRALAMGTGAAAVALVVALVVVTGGEEAAIDRPTGSVAACNGYAELCDRRVDQVAFAATHNSMSAAREPGWYLPNQRYGISRQLDDGIRTLLIDTHYGIETGSGTVVTEIARESATREEIERAIGAEGITRVERLRERLTGDADPEDARPYLCHVFCELGATELLEALIEIREFLDRHPDELVILFIEDVVTPTDAASAFEDSGLLRYAYVHRRGRPFPTLGELIEDDRRVLILGETHSGGSTHPWYQEGFALVQETPYTFHDPDEIADRAGCRPNRGTDHSPMFQLNHWIERIPRSPDLAGEVNDFDALLGRARRCERVRGLMPNLVAVDHHDRGDVLGVVRVLNGLERGASAQVRATP